MPAVTRIPLPQNNLVHAPTKVFDFYSEFATGGSTNNIVRAQDTSVKWNEAGTLRLTPSAQTGSYVVKTYAATPKDFSKADYIGLSFYCDQELPATAGINFQYGNDTTWANYRGFNFNVSSVGRRRGWQFVKVRFDQAAALWGPYGSPPPSSNGWSTGGTGATPNNNIQFLAIFLSNLSGYNIWLEGLYLGGLTRPKVVMYFDNWWSQSGGIYALQHTALKPTLDAYGWKVGIAMSPDAVGAGTNTSVAALQQMAAEGHDILLNDVTQTGLITGGFTQQQIRDRVRGCKPLWDALNIPTKSNFWVYNQNEFNTIITTEMAAAGIVAGRAGSAERWYVNTDFGLDSPLNFGSGNMDARRSSEMQAFVQRGILHGGAAIHMYWHNFRSGGTPEAAPPAESLTSWVEAWTDWAAVLRRWQLQGLVDVVSPSQWLNQLSNPRA